jgi:hypothetical protein
MNFKNVNDFVAKLEQNQPSANKNFKNQRKLDKVYLNVPDNFGRYQVLPMDSVITDFPYVELPGTREINIPRKNIKSDGTESVYDAWIKLLPKSAYTMKDETGREVSSLTAADEQLLNQAYSLHQQLWDELDARNNAMDKTIGKLIRRKNYCIFHAFCINRWKLNDNRSPERQNFSALFVVTSKHFSETLKEDMNNFGIVNTVGDDWLASVYNRELTNRDGFLMFTVQKNQVQPGFQFSVAHAVGKADYLKNISINQEDADLMSNPVETFLGWQAQRNDGVAVEKRRLFNPVLIQQAIDFMTKQLAQIRLAKQNGTDIAEAIKATNEEALRSQQPTTVMGQTTNDPVLAQHAEQYAASQNVAANPQAVVEKNTDPFSSPAAAHFNPMGGVETSSNGFTAPSFGGFGGSSEDLPF